MIDKDEFIKVLRDLGVKYKILGYEYFRKINKYSPIYDFTGIPYIEQPTFTCITCIDGNSKEVSFMSFSDYLKYDNSEIEKVIF